MTGARGVRLPLSASQLGEWCAHQTDPTGHTCNVGEYLVIHGCIDPVLFEAAARRVAEEVESLRVRFDETNGEPWQLLGPSCWSVTFHDVTSEACPEDTAVAWMKADFARTVDLLRDPLVTWSLFKVAQDRFWWCHRYHHILLDDFSLSLVVRRMAEVYTALVRGVLPSENGFGPLHLLLEDEAAYRASKQFTDDRNYWVNRFADPLEPARLGHRPPQTHGSVLRTTSYLAPSVMEGLRSAVWKAGTSWPVLMIATTAAYLQRMTGLHDVVVGVSVAARPNSITQRIPGMASNVLPVRIDVRTARTATELIRQTSQMVHQALHHQRYRHEDLLRELRPSGNEQILLGPEINIMSLGYDVRFAGHPVTAHNISNGPVDDLKIIVYDRRNQQRVRVDFDANSELYSADELANHQERYVRLLEAVVADPDRPISRIDILTAAERHRLLVDYNDTAAPLSQACLPVLFETQVAATPRAVAVVFGDVMLSYAQLNARANRLARALIARGVGPEQIVALALPRSPELVVSILAVLKAGSAYLPLDPEYPPARIEFMLDDARPALLLTSAQTTTGVPDDGATPRLVIDDPDTVRMLGGYPDADPTDTERTTPLTPQHPAYVIYTSGSSGHPKGVVLCHAGVPNLAAAQIDRFSIDARSRVLQLASPSFDASFSELCLGLLSGAALVMAPAEQLLPGPPLVALVKRQRVTHATLPPSVLAVLPVQDGLPPGMTVITAGEACPPELVATWSTGRRMINAYGPTETTVCATMSHPLSTDTPMPPPIGRPITNTRVYVLDAGLQPVPPGVPGELYISGTGLARGYLHQPGLTAQRFIADPHGPVGTRMYCTGDLVRWRSGGELEFVGRVDDQVKVRGFRIEPGEVEAVLAGHPDVARAAVVAREDRPGDQRLVAYVVAAEGDGARPDALREFVRARLPDYMVPTALVVLNALPLTANGKLDRRALLAPEIRSAGAGRAPSEQTFAAPRTPMEEMVAGIWSELLGIESIGIDDNFIDQGIHSLIAARFLSHVRNVFGVELPFSSIFESPTVAGLASRIEEHCRREETSARAPMQRIPRHGRLPASFAQERVYFIEQLSTESRAYQAKAALRFRGFLDVKALEQGLGELVRRHEIFRTTFPAVDGRLTQVIHEPQPICLPVVDLQCFPEVIQAAEVQRLIDEEGETPFDLNRLPLVRWKLLKLCDEEHVLIHVEHHMVHDGWSFNLFLGELFELYKAFTLSRPSPLLEPTLQFVDFAHWQRQWVLSQEARDQLEYWKEKLDDGPPLLNLPLDRPRPAEQTYRGDQVRVELPAHLCEALRALSRQEQVTLFMTMLAAFLVFLHRYTGQDDLSVGTAVANRRSLEAENLIGMIVNNLVLRTDLSGDSTFRDLLAQVRQVTLEGYAREDLPFDKIVEALNPTRDLSHNPLFQAMFSFHDSPLPDVELPGLSVSMDVAISNKTSKFDLDVLIIPHAELPLAHKMGEHGISVVWEYNTDLFDAVTVERMEAQYQTLLAGIIADPSSRISDLPLLTAAERDWLAAWNATPMAYPADRCVHEIFAEQVERTPDAVAVVFAGAELTYRELDARANHLARCLCSLGVRPDTLVGLSVERSLDMIVGMLGILKAGGAYVPIDPAYPAERVTYILKDAQISILLTEVGLRDRYLHYEGRIICLDTDGTSIAEHAAENPARDRTITARPRDLAYVLYTSGSTGIPKGVMIEHRSLVNFATTATRAYEITDSDRVLQFASVSFDTAVEEIYPCLTAGATLLLRTEAMLSTSDDFWRTCREWRPTVLNFPTAFWHQLTAELSPEDARVPACIRLVIVGGEEARPEKVERWHEGVAHLSQPPRLVNGYGPTEGTVTTTLYQCDPPAGATVPIGRPLGNAEVYLLDHNLHEVPVGAPGELYIGGPGVARGYWRRPGLTAERFLPNPMTHAPSGRLYKTGDLARLRPDGNLCYLGRLDGQVKIRGYRIEPGEIETALGQHPDVRHACVVVREDIPGNKRLVAYVVPRRPELSMQELDRFLAPKLPSYMVPSAFVLLATLPLTPNGKVDLRALPTPDQAQPATRSVAPRTVTEATLLTIWSEVLGAPHAGVHDNYFMLGGDSILSIQVVSRARQAGLRLTPKQIFQHRSIAELAAHVGTARGPIEAEQGFVTGPVPLTPIQHWFFEQKLPDAHIYNQSALIETPAGPDRAHLRRAIQHLLWHHDALRLRYVREEDRWQQVNADASPDEDALRIIDLTDVSSAEQAAALASAEAELQQSLDLTRGPIVRAALFHLGEDRPGRLLLIVHHLAVDTVSWRILLEDLTTLYGQLSRGETMDLPPKTTSFKEWANRLTDHAQSEHLTGELEHWTSADISAALSPIDVSTAGAAGTPTASLTMTLTEEETRALIQDVPAAYHTEVNDVLLTALLQGFNHCTGVRSLLVDLEGHGREGLFDDVDLSRTVGWFTTMFPVRLELPPSDDLGEALKAVKEQLRRVPKRGIGYGMLRYLRQGDAVDRLMHALPRAEVSFNYLGQFDRVLGASNELGATREWKFVRGQQNGQSHLLEIGGMIRAGRLEMIWTHCENAHDRATIERLASELMTALRALVAHCRASSVGGHTPSDFSARKLDQGQLDKLLTKIRAANQETTR